MLHRYSTDYLLVVRLKGCFLRQPTKFFLNIFFFIFSFVRTIIMHNPQTSKKRKQWDSVQRAMRKRKKNDDDEDDDVDCTKSWFLCSVLIDKCVYLWKRKSSGRRCRSCDHREEDIPYNIESVRLLLFFYVFPRFI